MAGQNDPYHHLPFFYSDMFELQDMRLSVNWIDGLETFSHGKNLSEKVFP